MLRGRGAGQPLLHRRDLRLVRDNVSNVTDDRIYTYQKAAHYPWITLAMFVPLVVTMTDDRISTPAMRYSNVCSPGVVTMTAAHGDSWQS